MLDGSCTMRTRPSFRTSNSRKNRRFFSTFLLSRRFPSLLIFLFYFIFARWSLVSPVFFVSLSFFFSFSFFFFFSLRRRLPPRHSLCPRVVGPSISTSPSFHFSGKASFPFFVATFFTFFSLPSPSSRSSFFSHYLSFCSFEVSTLCTFSRISDFRRAFEHAPLPLSKGGRSAAGLAERRKFRGLDRLPRG